MNHPPRINRKRRISVSNKKLRGVPRRLRALETWAARFEGVVRPRSDYAERYWNWKIPVHAALIEGHQTNLAIKSRCVAALLTAAQHLANAAATARPDGYYRVAGLITWPWLFSSEVTIFYDKEYYEGFLGDANELSPTLLSDMLSLSVPIDFLEHGRDVTQPEHTSRVFWWCIGEEA